MALTAIWSWYQLTWTMAATTITVSQETRKLLEGLKTGGATYDDVIRGLIIAHPTQLTMAELARRIREGKPHPIEELIARSREQPY
jgi:predicted CopG family antitoxin